jgi:diguanylate cyclase (GGDEF)-like protein
MAETGSPAGGLLRKLVADLARSPSGVGFVYDLLDAVVRAYGLRDAVVVVDDSTIGRQAFRAGRLPVGEAAFVGDAIDSAPGLHTDPDAVDPETASSLNDLCEIALQLELRRHDASHDALTGLFNRRSFDALLRQSSSRSSRYGWPFALVLMDMDGLKLLNDRYGHEEGDRVLRLLGAELRSSLRGGDAAARVGGDEFALILSNSGPREATAMLERVRGAVASVVELDIGYSVGVALAPAEATDPASLYRLADARLYEAKRP